mmetsp:Transcript_39306/g.90812  ORF Transcript_39306/g.90812 Transcript_39306/m.90812 type:complete len:227 (+) Transcript_39306:3-683(+)
MQIIAPAYGVTANVLTHGKALPEGITRVALVCTSGLFENPIITNLLTLLAMDSSSLLILPLMCSSLFVFPTQQALRESTGLSSLTVQEQEKLVLLIQSVFTEIAIEFAPAALGATEALLAARAQDISNRLWSQMQSIRERMLQPSIRVSDVASKKTSSKDTRSPLSTSSSSVPTTTLRPGTDRTKTIPKDSQDVGEVTTKPKDSQEVEEVMDSDMEEEPLRFEDWV